MKTTNIALLAAAATCLPPFAPPAIAELGHPSGCASCEPVEVTAPTEGYDNEGASLIRPWLRIGAPAGATALARKAGVAGHSLATGCHAEVRGAIHPREYHIVCR
jgi:hypothetical protein